MRQRDAEVVYARTAAVSTVDVGDDGEVELEFTRADDGAEVGARCGQEGPVFAVEADDLLAVGS